MVDHLIFDHNKWWQSEDPNYIGKTVISPKRKITVHGYNETYETIDSITTGDPVSGIPEGKISGQLKIDNIVYVLCHYVEPANNMYITGFFKIDDILQNGGVLRRLLTHVYQAVTSSRKKVAVW